MKTEYTPANSLTLAELQARATKGPYFTDETFRHVMTASGVVFDVRPKDDPNQSPADVELAVRLLNFAYAGGFKAIDRLFEQPHLRNQLQTLAFGQMRASLTILEGLQP